MHFAAGGFLASTNKGSNFLGKNQWKCSWFLVCLRAGWNCLAFINSAHKWTIHSFRMLCSYQLKNTPFYTSKTSANLVLHSEYRIITLPEMQSPSLYRILSHICADAQWQVTTVSKHVDLLVCWHYWRRLHSQDRSYAPTMAWQNKDTVLRTAKHLFGK